jgi:hypothetical protein
MTEQEILDSLLTKPKTAGKCVQANNLLTQTEKDDLYNIVRGIEAQGAAYNYDGGLLRIAAIIRSHNLVNNAGVVTNQKAMPYLIKQVLFYMVVACYKNGEVEETGKRKPIKTQEEIINYISSKPQFLQCNEAYTVQLRAVVGL